MIDLALRLLFRIQMKLKVACHLRGRWTPNGATLAFVVC
jgi:hypothetical protein